MRAVAFLSAIVALSVYKGKSFYVPLSIVSSTGLTFYLLFSVLRNKLRIRSSATYVTTTPEDVYTKPGSKRTRKNVCVIGAGPSGIATAKELLDEGHNVTCFEKYHDIGGVFLYSEKKGGAYDSTLLTIGNYLMAYSDFPPLNNEKYKFWHHTEYLDYLRKYIDHNMLYERANFQFDTEVVRVERAGAGWTVTTKNCKTQKTTENTYDAVAICSGTHQVPNIPKFKGQETSPIVIRHSETYKNAATDKDIKDKRVVSIGIGETGADISAEIAQHAESAYLAIRRTPHVVARNHWNLNHPADVFSTRAMFYSNINYIEFLHHQDQGLKAATAGPIGKAIFRGNLGLGDDVTAKIAELGKRSGGGVSSQFLTKNDKFIPYLLNGKLVEKPSIDRLEGRTVHFTDGSSVENVDTIMLCTGFVDNFPFLPKDLQIKNVRGLYKHAFNPEADTSIAYIGFSRPSTGGVPACSEAVARYWSLILSNQRKLPNDWKERTVIEGQAEKNFFHLSSRINTLVFWGQYIESLACHIDCQPKLLSYLFTRPWFWISLFYGPLIPAQFRLRGPHATPAAAEKVIANAPIITPTPFLVAQSATSILSFIGGSLFGFRAPMW